MSRSSVGSDPPGSFSRNRRSRSNSSFSNRSHSRDRTFSRSRSRSRSRSDSYYRSYSGSSRSRTSRSPSSHSLSPVRLKAQTIQWQEDLWIVGQSVTNMSFHFCDVCDLPILTYGRLFPCKHVFCLTCAESLRNQCHRCEKPFTNIETCQFGRIYMCQETIDCRRTYLSDSDLIAHINHRHKKNTNVQFNPISSTETLPISTLKPIINQSVSTSNLSTLLHQPNLSMPPPMLNPPMPVSSVSHLTPVTPIKMPNPNISIQSSGQINLMLSQCPPTLPIFPHQMPSTSNGMNFVDPMNVHNRLGNIQISPHQNMQFRGPLPRINKPIPSRSGMNSNINWRSKKFLN